MKSDAAVVEQMRELGAANAFRISKKRTVLEIILLLLSGSGMALAFAPANIPFFAWVCIIPLIWICAKRTPKRSFLYGLIWGYAWHFFGTFFLREIVIVIPFFFAVVLGLFNAIFAACVPVFCQNLLYPLDVRRASFDVREKFYDYPVSGEIAATLGLATLWIVLEWIRSWIFTGFPWNLLAASQYQNFSLIQICEYTGIYGVSFIVVLMNVAGYFALHGLRHSLPEGRYKRPFPLIGAIVLLIVATSWGVTLFHAAQRTYRDNAFIYAVGVVQPHLSQRRAGTKSQNEEALGECAYLTRQLILDEQSNQDAQRYQSASNTNFFDRQKTEISTADRLSRKFAYPLQLIVWPETAVPCPYYFGTDFDAYVDELREKHASALQIQSVLAQRPFASLYRETVRELLRDAKVPFVIGSVSYGKDNEIYNSALLLRDAVQKKGNYEYDLMDSYSKIHIVPFGEFVPLAWKFPVLDKWLGMGRSLTAGKAFRPLDVSPRVKVGTLICYEDVFPYTARSLAQNEAQFLLVITNDAWYPRSSEPEQHYINSIFRTIETRLPMVRCGNSNYSALVNPFGQLDDCVFKKFSPNGEVQFFPERRGHGCEKFTVPVLRNPPKTFYTRYGDVFALLCTFVFASVAIMAAVRCYLFSHAISNKLDAVRMRIRENFLKSQGKK